MKSPPLPRPHSVFPPPILVTNFLALVPNMKPPSFISSFTYIHCSSSRTRTLSRRRPTSAPSTSRTSWWRCSTCSRGLRRSKQKVIYKMKLETAFSLNIYASGLKVDDFIMPYFQATSVYPTCATRPSPPTTPRASCGPSGPIGKTRPQNSWVHFEMISQICLYSGHWSHYGVSACKIYHLQPICQNESTTYLILKVQNESFNYYLHNCNKSFTKD